MIDKSNDKVDLLIDDFFDKCKEAKKLVLDKTAEPREKVNTFRGRYPRLAVLIAVITCILAVSLVIVGFTTPKTVVVNIDNSTKVKTTTYETTAIRVDDFIKMHDVDFVYGQDYMDVQFYKGISNNMEINIKKAVRVTIKADGQKRQITVLPCTVAELLEKEEIVLDDDDIVKPGLKHKLKKGDKVVVKRVTKKNVVEEETDPYEVQYVADYNMTIGKTKVTQKGKNGLKKNTYKVTYVDGKEKSRKLIKSKTLEKRKDKVITYGTKILSGVPADLKYKKVYKNVRAVSYYMKGTPHGAYGLPCEYGTCAVDKDLIPLGSLLYIEGYGYAIANDTGTSIKGKTVDVYMEKLSQCGIWGARKVKVYVIEYA